MGLLSCNSPTEVVNRPLAVMTDGANVTLANGNSVPIFYLLINPNILALADYVLCQDPSSGCPRVAPHATVRVPYGNIFGYASSEKTVTVTQWRLQRTVQGTYQTVDLRSTTVPLQ